MNRRALAFAFLSVCMLTGCTKGEQQPARMEDTSIETMTSAATDTQPASAISSGFIDSGAEDYATLYQLPDESASAVARAYTGDTVEIYALQGQWYQVKLGEVEGYLLANHITFSKPVETTTEKMTETTVQTELVQTNAAVQTTVLPKPSISASIKVTSYTTIGDGDAFVLNVNGNYAYYVCNYTKYYADGTIEQKSITSSEASVELETSSICESVKATVTPYNVNGVAGTSVSCSGELRNSVVVDSNVSSCNYYGQINTHGGVVAGFTTAYVVENGSSSHVRDSLGNAWHITAVHYCYSRGVNWYELYDSDDGDYYGWVDANYIDFY